MTDNRKRVLEMLDSHKITIDEALRLLDAMETGGNTATATKTGAKRDFKYFRILVDMPQGHHGNGPEKVNVRVPVSLVRAGMKFRSLIPPEAGERVDAAMKEKGFQTNLKNMSDADIEEFIQALAELEIDVDENEKHGKIKVFVE